MAELEALTSANSLLDELQRENDYLRGILDALPAAIYATDGEGRIAYFNKAATEIAGRTPAVGTDRWSVLPLLYDRDGKPLSAEESPIAKLIKSGDSFGSTEIVAERPDGTRIPLMPFPKPLYDASGRVSGAVDMLVDISDRKRVEQSLARRIRQQAALYNFTDRLQRAQSLSEIYTAALEAIVDALQCRRASILLFDDSGVMRFVAWRGLSEAYRAAVEGHSPWTADAPEPQPICMDDIATAGLSDGLRETILGEGIRAVAFIPVVANGKLLGKFMAYYDEPRLLKKGEIGLAVTIARQLAFGIDRKRAEEALRQNEERLRLATQTGKVGLWEWDIPANRVSWTDSLYPLHGLKKEEFNPTIEGFSALIHPGDRERVHAAVERTLKDNAPYELEMRILRPDGQVAWLYANAIVLRDGETPVRLLGATFDITERKRAEEAVKESEARERAHAAQLEAIMEAVPAAVWIAHDPDCRTITGNTSSYEVLRMAPASNVSLSAEESERPVHYAVVNNGALLPPDEMPVQRAARGEVVRDFEMGIRFVDGTSRYLLGNATPLRDAGGKARGAVSAFVDITERKHAEAQRDLLLAELTHRVKNTLATVISIAHQSFSKGPSFEESRRSFEMRIRALAQTHVRLAEANWSGVSVERILLDETAPYRRDDGMNVRISGPSIVLNPKSAVTLGMAVHELATNAAKYGALSTKTGAVEAQWHIAPDRHVRISWIESGGPAVASPARSGFGRLLLERVLTSDLSGTVHLDFARDGFKCAIAFPLDHNEARLN